MSDPVDTETMKVCEAANDKVSSPKDNMAAESKVTDQSQNSKDEHGGNNNKRDVQVKNVFTLTSSHPFCPVTTWKPHGHIKFVSELNLHSCKDTQDPFKASKK